MANETRPVATYELARSVTLIPQRVHLAQHEGFADARPDNMLNIPTKSSAVAGDVVRWNSLYEFSDLGAERNSSPARALYVQGYGVIFVLRVGFPLTPPEQITASRSRPAPTRSGKRQTPVWPRGRPFRWADGGS